MPLERDRITRLADRHYPGRLLNAQPLSGGMSAETWALELAAGAASARTETVILRIPGADTLRLNPHAAENEFTTLEFLQSLHLPTPAPLVLDVSRAILPAPYLIMACVPGQTLYAGHLPPDFAAQMGSALARIHTAGLGVAATRPHLPRISAQPIPQLPTNLALDTSRFQDTIRAAWPFPANNPLTLLHGDFWIGNLLWHGSRLAGVIDWEDAALGDPLADLAIARLDLMWIYSRQARDAFTRAYLAENLCELGSLPWWDLWAAQRLARLVGNDLAGWVAFLHDHQLTNLTPADVQARYQAFVDQAVTTLR